MGSWLQGLSRSCKGLARAVVTGKPDWRGSASELSHAVVGRIQFLPGWNLPPNSLPHGPLHRAAPQMEAGFTRVSKQEEKREN